MSGRDAISEELQSARNRLGRALAELRTLIDEAADGLPVDSRIHIRQMSLKLDAIAELTDQRDAIRTALGHAVVAERRAAL